MLRESGGTRALPAFVISYRERALSGEASTRLRVGERISGLWPDSRQIEASSWIVESGGPADQIRDQLADVLREGDALVVVGAGAEAAWAGLEATDADWVAQHLP